MSAPPLRWIATCARGLEEILRGELEREGLLAAPPPEGDRGDVGGVGFAGGPEAGMRASWRLRTANRILVELAAWPAPDGDALYEGARRLLTTDGDGALAPARLLTADRSFAITASSSRSAVRDTRWVALRVKDGIVDGQRQRFGRRASVERVDPDLALRLRLHGDRATLLLDISVDPLDHRGYRVAPVAAPLREQLAAATVLASGWDGTGPVVDPMCGSGTLLAEAGAIRAGLPPLRLRRRWAFERLPGFDAGTWAAVRSEPFAAPDAGSALVGRDLDAAAIAAARANLAAAGLDSHADLAAGDGFELVPPAGPGLVLMNPPYGDRLAEAPESWKRIGDLLKRRYSGWRAAVVAGDAALGRRIGLRPTKRIPIRNGPLEARILVFSLW